MASIRKRTGKRGPSYEVRYRDPDNRQRTRSFKTKADGRSFAKTIEADVLRGDWRDPQGAKTTFLEQAERYMATLTHLKPKTIADYQGLLRSRILPAFGNRRLGKIRPSDVKAWVSAMDAEGVSPSRQRNAHNLFAAIIRSAVYDDLIKDTPSKGIKIAKQPDLDPTIFTPEQVHAVADAAGPPNSVLTLLLAYSGVRWGEAAALRRQDVDFLRRRLHVRRSVADVNGKLIFGTTKTHQNRYVALPPFLVDALELHLDEFVPASPDALIFCDRKGGPLRLQNWRRRVWEPALVDARLPRVGVHALRHTCASMMIDAGASIIEVQRHLGHKNASTTLNVYAHLMPGAEDSAAVRLQEIHEGAIETG